MGFCTTPLLLPAIYLLQAVTSWRSFLNPAFSGASIDYTTCSTTSPTDLLCPSFLPPLPPHQHCCDQNSFSTYQSCKGEDSLVYTNVPVCQEIGGMTARKLRPECRAGCSLATYDGAMEDISAIVVRDNTSQYCISTMCDTIAMQWKINLEICRCQVMTENPVERLGDSDEDEGAYQNTSTVR